MRDWRISIHRTKAPGRFRRDLFASLECEFVWEINWSKQSGLATTVCRNCAPPTNAAVGALIGAFLLVCLSSCAVGPDFQSPEPPEPTRFTKEEVGDARRDKAKDIRFIVGKEVPQRWWEAFQNKKLNSLVESAIEHNPSLQAAEAAIQIAYYNAESQKGLFLPSLALSGNESLNLPSNERSLGTIDQTIYNQAYPTPANILLDTPTVNSQNPSTYVYSLFLKQLTVSYTFDIWGQNKRAVESLEAQTDQQRYQLEAAYLALTSNVAVAAIREASLRAQMAAVERVVKIQREMLDLIRKQEGVGGASRADVLTQDAALGQALQMLPPLKKQIAQQRDLITALVGRYSSDEVAETFWLRELTLPRNVPLSLPSTFVRQRPDIRAAEAKLHSASANVGVAIAARLPKITLSANGGFSALKLAELFAPGTQFYTLAANAAQPLFAGFSLVNQQQAAEAALAQAEAQYRQTVITAFQNVADALKAIRADAEAVKNAAHVVKVSGENLEIVRGQLAMGSVSILVVLNAQQSYLLAMLNHAQAQGNLLADIAGLFMALGGGWQDQALRTLPPTANGLPTKEQIESMRKPVNASSLPSALSDVFPH